MKDFINSRTWEDWIVYAIIGVMIVGGILFVVGYMFSFDVRDFGNGYIVIDSQKTSITQMIKQDSYPNDLFSLMTYLIENEKGTNAYNMCVTAITGTALLFSVAAIVIVVMVWGTIVDIIIPRIKAKKGNKTSAQ